MTDADFANPAQESIWRVTKQLKKEQYTIYNCIASILSDAAFVSEVRGLYPSTPLLANLRCGLWYTRQPDGSCYFKSTDGHNGNWSFSCTRLNWHVCELAAKQGGVIIVDATRKGKRFPDAMTKTIPIWATVVNRAVARKRAEAAQRRAAAAAATSNPSLILNSITNAQDPVPGAAAAVGEAATDCPVVARVDSLSQWLNSPFAAALEEWEASKAGASAPGDGHGASSSPVAPPSSEDSAPLAPGLPPDTVQGTGTSIDMGAGSGPGGVGHEDMSGTTAGVAAEAAPAAVEAQDGRDSSAVQGQVLLKHGVSSSRTTDADAEAPVAGGGVVDLGAASAAHVSCSPEESCGRRAVCHCGLGEGISASSTGGGGGDYERVGNGEGHPEALSVRTWPPRCGRARQGRNIIAANKAATAYLQAHEEGADGEMGHWEQLGRNAQYPHSLANGVTRGNGSAFATASSTSSASVASSASLASLASSRSSSEDSCDLGMGADTNSLTSLPSAPGSGAEVMARCNSDSACNLYNKFATAAADRDNGANSFTTARNACYGASRHRRLSNSMGSINAAARSTTAARSTSPSRNYGSEPVVCYGAADVGAGADGTGAATAARGGDGTGGIEWDEDLHLPLWISANERAQIERRIDGWVDSLLRVGADVEGLAKVLHKPLRPLWISQSSTIWVDEVAQPDQLPFTPLYLVSASQQHSYLRQACGVHITAAAAADSDTDDVSGSDTDGEGGRRHSSRRASRRDRPFRYPHPVHSLSQPNSWTYVYVPGAGDDEESWAAGLTPAVFWAHCPKLLRAGPSGINDVVRKLLQKEAVALVKRGANSSVPAASGSPVTHGSIVAPPPGFGPSARGCASNCASSASGVAAYVALTDEHHLLPAGCRSTAVSVAIAAAGGGGGGTTGLYFLGRTGIALGSMAAGASPACWKHVDAVLSCGLQPHPSMAAVAAGAGAAVSSSDRRLPRYLHLPVQHYKHHRTSLLQHLGLTLDFLSRHLEAGHTVLIHDENGLDTCVCITVALLLACFGPVEGGSAGGGNGTAAPHWAGPYRNTAPGTGMEAGGHVSKDDVRQRLAYVSSWYPLARPTRGMLRQVYNHFVQSTGGCGEGGVGNGSDVE